MKNSQNYDKMEKSNLIAVQTFCSSHEIGTDFIYSIREIGLIELVELEEETDDFIEENQLPNLEKTVRLHKDLHINNEGIAAIFELLQKLDSLNQQVNHLQNRLAIYERSGD